MIEVETILDKECRKAIYNAGKKAVKPKKVKIFSTCCFLFFLLLGIFYLFLAFDTHIEGKTGTCFVLGVLFILIAFFGRWFLFKVKELSLSRKTLEELTIHYAFSEEGVVITRELSESSFRWAAFDQHGTEGHYLWVRRAQDKAFVMVDKNKLSSEDAARLEAWFDAVKEAG